MSGAVSTDCVEIARQVIDLEQYYQELSLQINQVAVNSTLTVDNWPLYKAHTTQPCLQSVADAWSWLDTATICLQTHRYNAAQYNQFYQELSHCSSAVQQLSLSLTNSATTSSKSLLASLQSCLESVLLYEARIDQLMSESERVVPVHLRSLPLSHVKPATVHSIVDYCTPNHKSGLISSGQDCLLLDNSDHLYWRVKLSSGQVVVTLPALIFVIPAPHLQTIRHAVRLKQQLVTSWANCLSVFKRRTLDIMLTSINKHETSEMSALTEEQRSAVVDYLISAVALMTSLADNESRDVTESRDVGLLEDMARTF